MHSGVWESIKSSRIDSNGSAAKTNSRSHKVDTVELEGEALALVRLKVISESQCND